MNDFVKATFDEVIAGIPMSAWNAFFKTFREDGDLANLTARVRTQRAKLLAERGEESDLTRLFRQMLDDSASVAGRNIAEVANPIDSSAAKVNFTVSIDDLSRLSADIQEPVETIVFRPEALYVPTTARVAYIRERIAAISNRDPSTTTVRVELELAASGLFTVRVVQPVRS